LVRITIIVISRRAVGADSPNADILLFADTLIGDSAVKFIDSETGGDAAYLSILIINLSSKTAGTGALDDVISRGAVALTTVEVVELVKTALHSADPLVDVIELTSGTLGAEIVDQVEARLADTST
jgi:hypothetical protein